MALRCRPPGAGISAMGRLSLVSFADLPRSSKSIFGVNRIGQATLWAGLQVFQKIHLARARRLVSGSRRHLRRSPWSPNSAVKAETSIGWKLRTPKRVGVDQTTSPVMVTPRRRISTADPMAGGWAPFTIAPCDDTFAKAISAHCWPTRKCALIDANLRSGLRRGPNIAPLTSIEKEAG